MVRPVTVTGEAEPLAAIAPGLQVAVKPVIALPPVTLGGVKVMVA